MNPTLYIIVCGGRDFNDYERLRDVITGYLTFLEKIPDRLLNVIIIEGGAKGADRLARRFAIELGYEYRTFEADWDKYGNAAGPLRNVAMAEFARDLLPNAYCIAFWDGKSRGTEHMISTARSKDIPVHIEYY